MKMQLALDRMSVEQALDLAKLTAESIHIIEVGTSLIKEFGLSSVQKMKNVYPELEVLADLKTIDEGAYEFKVAFEAGADIATVMGASAIETVSGCYDIAQAYGKSMMIDLLEVSDEKISDLLVFDKAIFCVHAPADKKDRNLASHLHHFREQFPVVKRLAVAGSIQLEGVEELRKIEPEIVVVGSSITKHENPEAAAKQFQAAMNGA